MLKVTYLHHSGFSVELDRVVLIFDAITKIPDTVLDTGKPIFVFVSHVHHDHFDKGIFQLRKLPVPVRYIISDDVPLAPMEDTVMVSPYEKLSLVCENGGRFDVQTFGSTDAGVSFLVNNEDTSIFFSGDLNWWAWDTKKRPNINPEVEERDYKDEIARLKSALHSPLTLAFVPVDPRLDAGTDLAAMYFIGQIHPKYLIPMHFWDDYSVIDELAQKEKSFSTKIPLFSHDNEVVLDLK